MKTIHTLFLLIFSIYGFGQILHQEGKVKNIASAGTKVLAMGEAGNGMVMVVGTQTKAGPDELTDAFAAFYHTDYNASFKPIDVGLSDPGALLAVCSDDRNGAWVAGYQTDADGTHRGVLRRIIWNEGRKNFYLDSPEQQPENKIELNASVRFNALCKLPNGDLIIGGQYEDGKKRKKSKIAPVLYYYDGKRLDRMDLPDLKVDDFARVTNLFATAAGTKVAIIVEHLTTKGLSLDRYREFVLEFFPETGGMEVTPQWEIGGEQLVHCNGFSMNVDEEIVATGNIFDQIAGPPWLSIAGMNATRAENQNVTSAYNNPVLGGHAVVRGQIITVSGSMDYTDEAAPVYDSCEEFLYYPRTREYSDKGAHIGSIPVKGKFYDADFYEDTNFNVWLYGQQETDDGAELPVAILYEASPTLNRGKNEVTLVNGQLTVEEMTLDFGAGPTDILPAGKKGHLRVVIRNDGETVYQLKAEVSVEGTAQGIQFTDNEPTDSKGLKGIGRDKKAYLSFPLETTAVLSTTTGTAFVLQVRFADSEQVLLEKRSEIRTKGSDFEGYKIYIDEGFGANTTRANPDRTNSQASELKARVSSSRELKKTDIYPRHNDVRLNKGERGEENGVTLRKIGFENGLYIYEVTIAVELDTADNAFTIVVEPDSLTAIESVPRYFFYEKEGPALPTLHYFGIAPDYAALRNEDGFRSLKYNAEDVTDVRNELQRFQRNSQLYGRVKDDLLTTAAETNTQALRDYFGRLGQLSLYPDSTDYIGENDLVVIHFAAHGGLNGEDYTILPSDYNKDNFLTRVLNYEDDVLQRLLQLKGRIVILIDACHDPLPQGNRGAGDPDPELMDKIYQIHENVEDIVTFVAASKNESAYEHERWKNGLFTEALLEALRGRSGTVDGEGVRIDADGLFNDQSPGIITVDELAEYLRRRVPGLITETPRLNKEQHPQLIYNPKGESTARDFPLFVLPPRL